LHQVGDLLLGVADGREDLLVVLAQLGGSIAQRQALVTMRDRVAQNGEVAEHGGMYRLRHLQVLHLGIGKRLVNLIDRTTGHASVVEYFDPLGAGLLASHWHDDLHNGVPVLGPGSGSREALIGDQIWTLDSTAEAPVDLIATGGDVDMPVLGLKDPGGNTGGMVIPRLRSYLATHQPA